MCMPHGHGVRPPEGGQKGERYENVFTLLDVCASSLRRGHANLLCIVPISTDDPRRESLEGEQYRL